MTNSNPTKFDILGRVAALCAAQGMQHVIVSPGSRSAPLTVAFHRQPNLQCRVVMDERAAGFIALGLAQQTGRSVGLICTSGTAALNYGPAVTEAFYQQIPLIVFTADRPPEWIDQQDGQTIHQQQLYGPHCRGSFDFPVDHQHPDAQWHAERLVSEALNRAVWPTPGPVQINVPLREPLYLAPESQINLAANRPPIRLAIGEPSLTEESWADMLATWQQAGSKLVIAGTHPPDSALSAALIAVQNDPTVVVIGDITANLHQSGSRVDHADMLLGTKSAATLAALRPELIVSFGGPVVSKYLKLFLRKNPPQAHWYIQPAGQVIDTFQALTQVITVNPLYFFGTLAERAANVASPIPPRGGEKIEIPSFGGLGGPEPATYQAVWLNLEKQAQQLLPKFFVDMPFSEFAAVYEVMRRLPAHSRLQLGNSMPVRYASYIGLGPAVGATNIRVNANRGTSGIDGSLSTTVGAALATTEMTTLISGDLAFFYDRNGLWHHHIPPNLRVVILNNHGGGIFKLIDGPNKLPEAELDEYFFTPQPLTAKNTAADHHCTYFYCDNLTDLQRHLTEFFVPRSQAAILEIETDGAINTRVFQEFKGRLAELAV